MGNSSSTASSSTTTTNGEQYDVFISFRGEDTRDGFTSHLYHALNEKQITTFIDKKLVRGEEILEGLLSVIRESKISVIVFSENYTFSKWCLLELAEIMKCREREKKKQIVIPVFYKVEPSDVRKSYEAAFATHENEWRHFQEENKIEWRPALTEASQLSGIVVPKGRNEAEFVRDIVKDVWNKLYNIRPCDFKELVVDFVGIEKPIERVVSLLCLGESDFRIIGIWGMGGMGKTTIADKVFHLVSHQFEKTYFAPSVRAQSEKDGGLICLRDKIISTVLNEKNSNIGSPSIPQSTKRRLNQKKVLIVLDDVDKLTKWKDLAGGLDRLGPGSRIILTTRDKQVLRNCGVEDDNIYKVDGLNRDEAFQLFCNYAFKQNHPTEDLEDLSREVVKIAKDVPLVVKVLGSSLYKKSKRDWENAVDKFQKNLDPQVLDVLKISYYGLDEEEKGLFLDIACFVEFKFKKDEVYFAPNLLSDREFSLSGLIDKSLVTEEHGRIKMHDLLREMGREIVHKESPNKPGNRSRLWRQEDVLHTLKHNDGTDAVQGIFLKLKDVHLSPQAFTKMYNLRTLITTYKDCDEDSDEHYDEFPDEDSAEDFVQAFTKMHNLRTLIKTYKDSDELHPCNYFLPDELRYLHFKSFPSEILPSGFNPGNLVELDLSHSIIKQLWEGMKCVPKLKRLNLSCCWNLNRIPDLSDIPSAESINLHICVSLLEIHSSRECPKNLHSLKLSGCNNLSRFPSNIHIEGSKFSLSGCIRLTKFPHILGNIKELCLSGSGVEEVPSTIQSLSKLEILQMINCTRLKRISKSICKLKSFIQLSLGGCHELESFQDILEGMELQCLHLDKMAIKELLPSIINSNQLEQLVLSDCKDLETFPSSISNLNLYGGSKLEKLSPLSGLCSLKQLNLNNCNLTEISEDIGCLSSLEWLLLNGNVFERLPKSIKKLSKLYSLKLNNCGMLRSLPELPSCLRKLEAMNCKQLIQSLPDESEFNLCAGGSIMFNFMCCLKLNQEAVRNLVRVSVLKMQVMGTEKIISLFKSIPPPPFRSIAPPVEEVEVGICLPGGEIPEWFSYKNIGSSIDIPVLRNDCGRSSYIMGFAVCLVIGFDQDCDVDFSDCCLQVYNDIDIETSDGHKEGFFDDQFPLFDMSSIDSDHILLGYKLSRKCYEFFQELDTLLANRGMSDYVGTSFEFDIECYRSLPRMKTESINGCKVKNCGIQPIYVQAGVMNSVSINQDTGDTSGCIDAVEETCEPHPLRICTGAKDSEGSIDDNRNFNSNSNKKETAIEDLDLELCLGHSSFYSAGDTSGCIDAAEETCEPHPLRICTEAKDSEGSIDDNSNFNSNSNNNYKETAIEDLDLELCLGHSSFYGASKKDCEVKHCGIHPINVQSQVMDYVAINQDTGDTSGSNDTEETCEPHSKRICTEANIP